MLIYTTNRHFGLVDTNRMGGGARGEYNRRQGQPVLSSQTSVGLLSVALEQHRIKPDTYSTGYLKVDRILM